MRVPCQAVWVDWGVCGPGLQRPFLVVATSLLPTFLYALYYYLHSLKEQELTFSALRAAAKAGDPYTVIHTHTTHHTQTRTRAQSHARTKSCTQNTYPIGARLRSAR